MDASEPTKSFEEYMKELDKILAQMGDTETTSLDQILDAYEYGTTLITKCEQILADATMRIKRITDKIDKNQQ